MKCFYAYTAPGANYPEFINVSRDDTGQVIVTVRSAPTFDVVQSAVCGSTSAIKLTRRQVDDLILGCGMREGDTRNREAGAADPDRIG